MVINAPPSAPPYALLGLYHYISSKVPAVIKSFVHCSAHESINELLTLFTTGGNPKVDSPKLKITIIWKEGKFNASSFVTIYRRLILYHWYVLFIENMLW